MIQCRKFIVLHLSRLESKKQYHVEKSFHRSNQKLFLLSFEFIQFHTRCTRRVLRQKSLR